jgi:hypothetical protein
MDVLSQRVDKKNPPRDSQGFLNSSIYFVVKRQLLQN